MTSPTGQHGETQMTFPSFYAECAYRDGQRDAAAGHSNSRPSYMRHGDPEPVGMHWYEAGRKAV
jgi:hypothetical protein